MARYESNHVLFGGKSGWRQEDWTSSDDRVRGGMSQSFLQLDKSTATFCGDLDIDTLGGAGFASQRTTGDDRCWDLSSYDGIQLVIDKSHSDNKSYTFILKDELLPKNSKSGREQSTVSWEFEFQIDHTSDVQDSTHSTVVQIPWTVLKPTYRGREKTPKKPLDTAQVKRMSIMMRSYFGAQKGSFQLCIDQISAYKAEKSGQENSPGTNLEYSSESSGSLSKQALHADATNSTSIWSRLLLLCCRL